MNMNEMTSVFLFSVVVSLVIENALLYWYSTSVSYIPVDLYQACNYVQILLQSKVWHQQEILLRHFKRPSTKKPLDC